MPIVYIVNLAGHDFDSAKKFGEIKAVTKGNINLLRPDRDLYHIIEGLKEFNQEEDYLLLSGNVLANVMCIMSLIHQKVNLLNLLVYNAKNQDYVNHTLALADQLKFIRK